MRSIGCALFILCAASLPQNAAADPCEEVQRAIDARATAETPAAVLLRLGPHFGPRALPALLDLGQQGSIRHRLAAYGAFGLARHAEGLRLITQAPPPPDAAGRLGYSLATLALGASTDTGTIADAVRSADVDRRRGAMWVLSRMKQVRPRQLLYEGLRDADPEVRLTAAEALVRYGSRSARRTLSAVLQLGPDPLRSRALEALIEVGHRFPTSVLHRLAPEAAARAYARAEARPSLAALQRAVGVQAPGLRAGALGVAAAHPEVTRQWLARACRGWAKRFGALGRGERAMAGSLLGDGEAQERLAGLEGDARTGGLRVLLAFAATPSVETRIDTATADRVAAGLAAWWPTLTEVERARVLASLGTIDAPTSVRFARRVLTDARGAALAAAAGVLRDHGAVSDAKALVEATAEPPSLTDAPALAAAARLCRLERE